MGGRSRDTLVLTLPSEAQAARWARLASTHFFRQNGVGTVRARLGARTVEKRCAALVRAARRNGSAPPPLVLAMRLSDASLEVFGRSGRDREVRFVRLDRPGAA